VRRKEYGCIGDRPPGEQKERTMALPEPHPERRFEGGAVCSGAASPGGGGFAGKPYTKRFPAGRAL